MSEDRHSLWSALLKGAAGAVGGVLVLNLLGLLGQFWTLLGQVNMSISKHLFAQSLWPNWLAYLSSLWPALLLARWALRRWRNRKSSTSRFKKLTLDGVVWRWSGVMMVSHGLKSFCPACDNGLVYEERGVGYLGERRVRLFCDRCNVSRTDQPGGFADLQNRVDREIDRLIRTGQWRRHVDDAHDAPAR